MKEQVVIIGASGHGKVVADIIQKSGDTVVGFLDDNRNFPLHIAGIPILGTVEEYRKYINCKFIIAVGSAAIRKRIVEEVYGVKWYTAIHPSAVISNIDVSIGEGTVIMANAVVNPGTEIGKHCIINTSAVVEHDNMIGNFVHISVGAKLAGNVRVGDDSWIGIGAVVSNNLSICEGCVIGAGGISVKNIKEPGTYIGVPVKRLNIKKDSV